MFASSLDLADDLSQREVGRPLAIRDAAPDQHGGVAVELGRQLARKPGLADPGLAQDQGEAAVALIDDARENLVERGQLHPASDQRRLEMPRERRHAFHDVEDPRHVAPFAADGLGHNRVAKEPEGGRPGQDLGRARPLLEPPGECDRRSRYEAVAGFVGSCENLAVLDRDPQIDPFLAVALEHVDQCCDLCLQLSRSARGTERVILVRARHSEDSHHLVA